MKPLRNSGVAAALALAVSALWAPTASATFHLMRIREVYPGSSASPSSEYVELQMYSAGQNLVGGHSLRTYDAGGSLIQTNGFGANVPNGVNQATLVLATPEAEARFGITADAALSPSGQLDPAGGAVCWESLDCVAWGSFSGSLPSPAGAPADPAGIPDAMALRRTIAPGCPTLLEPGDDTDNSAADFADAFPNPRPNSIAPAEHPCSSPVESGGRGGGGAPQTGFRRRPPKRTRDRTPTFRFGSNRAGSTFECKLDRKPFHACHSPYTTRRLSFGRHRLRVRARDRAGNVDPSPASYSFRVVRRR
jgi:hypothetical protein